MRVLMTGGAGLIGKVTAERLIHKGWNVRIIDTQPGVEIGDAEYITGNILDYDGLLRHMRGCDVVIHLAAFRSPNLAPGHEVFQVNVAGTFNVFEAAAAAGIRRVVQASSINALGGFYGIVDVKPRYFPIDEDHPTFTTDPYSFSKQTIEDIGAYYWRRDGISSVALRFPGVYSSGYTQTEAYLQRREVLVNLFEELLNQPELKQQATIAAIKQRALEYRSLRPFEFMPPDHPQPSKPALQDDPLFWTYIADRTNFWAFIDVRDAAQSLEKGLTADYEGSHALFINDTHNALAYDCRTLIRLFFPEVNAINSDLSGSSSLISIDKARRLIAFEPEHSIQQQQLS